MNQNISSADIMFNGVDIELLDYSPSHSTMHILLSQNSLNIGVLKLVLVQHINCLTQMHNCMIKLNMHESAANVPADYQRRARESSKIVIISNSNNEEYILECAGVHFDKNSDADAVTIKERLWENGPLLDEL